LDTPPFPEKADTYSTVNPDTESWTLKDYPSNYLSLDAQMRLVEDLSSSITGRIFREYDVDTVKYHAGKDIFTVVLSGQESSRIPGTKLVLNSRRVLFTTGHFGPLAASLQNLTRDHQFRQLEIGFRIQQSSERAFFRNMR
jgi:hypothetical protein